MVLEDELEQLESYYRICNYTGQLVCTSLINGINDILAGKSTTVDMYDSNREELEARISTFYSDIEKYIIVDN